MTSRAVAARDDAPRGSAPPLRVLVSPGAAERLAYAREAVRACPPGARIQLIGATRGAADDLAREIAAAARATFGIERFSLTQLAAKRAMMALAAAEMTPGSALAAEAVAARAAFEALHARALQYFAPVAAAPGFPKALARTLQELRLAGVAPRTLKPFGPAGPDLASLLERFDTCFLEAGASDRAHLFRTAAGAASGERRHDLVVFVDVPIGGAAERALIEAVAAGANVAVATVPHGDAETLEHLLAIGAVVEERRGAVAEGGASDLAHVRRYLFDTGDMPPARTSDGSLELFSAPGESRECVEIARRLVHQARAGVRFDEMAVLVRSPHSYFGLLEHALGRAGVPAWFDRGTRRPHPAGRAFLALLACASERLSAARFAEYLSLAQVPDIVGSAAADGADGPRDACPAGHVAPELPWARSDDDALGGAPASAGEVPDGEDREAALPVAVPGAADDRPVVAGSLRAPWRWESLLVEAAVIGHDAARWRRRLDGKAAELRRHLTEVHRDEGDEGGRVMSLERTLQQLDHLRAFALPVIDELASWPREATWGGWLDRFASLTPRVLRVPTHVLRVLADLRPMSSVGPIDLDEARRVLGERLLTVEADPPARRFGRVFVGTPQQARGRSFRVVFVPGLAERLFPQTPREDPLLLDSVRMETHPPLRTQPRRLAAERLLLQLAAGAATERLFVSYPRIELTESRARVPSFYALDLVRAVAGRIPDYEALEAQARDAGRASLAWPAPPRPADAIDDLEHDLAVVRQLLDDPDRARVRGRAHYLLKLNDCLRRSVVDRWLRGEPKWSSSDGLLAASKEAREALAGQRLAQRPYSLSALQRFSACPYQFLLSAVYRLQPVEQPEPLQRMDPLTRGSLFHEMQARFLRTLAERGELPVTGATRGAAEAVLDATVDAVADRAHDDLAPAVERVWVDEIASIRRDLHGWLQCLARDGDEWRPQLFEFAFGHVPGERDPGSVRGDVRLPGGYRLRGAVDLIEVHRTSSTLRVTDHKTGRRPDGIEKVIVGGGAVLQPVLYSMAVEEALGQPVSIGRLFYCTAAGSYYEHSIPLNDRTRAAGLEALQVVDRAIEHGFLAAAPGHEACARCDFRPVCGPDVPRRISRKPADRLADLAALRGRP